MQVSYELDYYEELMTFQVAMIGSEGIVIASDRLANHVPIVAGIQYLGQKIHQPKYIKSDSEAMVCFASGGPYAATLARRIVRECDPSKTPGISKVEWESRIEDVAKERSYPYPEVNEILIVRTDTIDRVWKLLHRVRPSPKPDNPNFGDTQENLTEVLDKICTGNISLSRFLPQHLWKPRMRVAELKLLAALTLSFATEDERSYVGPPFDIMCLKQNGSVEWSVLETVVHENFLEGIRQLVSQTVQV